MASKNLSVTISGDPSSLIRAVRAAERSMGDLSRTSGTESKKVEADQTRLHATMHKTSSAFAGVGLAAAKAAGAGGVLGFAGALTATGTATVAFDKSMRNVNSIAQLSESNLKSLEKQVLSLAGKTAQAPKTLADGLYDLVSSGFNAKQSMLILASSAKAATAGLTTTEISTKAVASVLNAYHRPAKDAAQISDDLFQTVNKGVISFEQLSSTIGDVLPFASSLGVNLKEIGAAASTLTKAGISPEETMTRLKNVMVTLMKPGTDLQAALKKLGEASGESLIKHKGLQGALEAIVGTTDGTKAAVAALFPNIRSLGGALALTGKNAKGAESDLASFKNTSGATNTALSQQSKSISYQWNKMKSEVSAGAISLGLAFITASQKGGALYKAFHDLTTAFKGMGPDLKTIGDAFKSVGEVMVSVVRRALPVVGDSFKGMLHSIKGVIELVAALLHGDFRGAMNGMKDIVAGAVSTAMGQLRFMVGLAKDIAVNTGKAIGKGFASVGGTIYKAAQDLGSSAIHGLGSLLSQFFDFGKKIVGSIIRGIKSVPSGIAGAITGAAKGALGAVGGVLGIGEGIGRKIGKTALPTGGSGGGSLMGANSALSPIAGIGSRFGLHVSSGKRAAGGLTASGGISYHGSGEAIDMADGQGPDANKMRFFQYMKSRYGSRLAELIYTPGGAGIKDGQPYTYTGAVAAEHFDHVHVALDLGRPGPGVGDGLGRFKGDGPGRAAAAARHVGLAGSDAVTAVAIAGAESGYDPHNRLVSPVEDSRGLWQINTYAHHEFDGQNLYDPDVNARAMYKVSSGGHNWGPWSTFGNGAYRKFLDVARGAVVGSRGGSSGGASGGGGGSGGGSSVDMATHNAAVARKQTSRLLNSIIGPAMDGTGPHAGMIPGPWGSRPVHGLLPGTTGITALGKRAAGLATSIDDADAAYGRLQRLQGQSDEDLGTDAGRTKRISEINALKAAKQLQLAREQKELAALRQQAAKLQVLIKKLRATLVGKHRVKGVQAARVRSRIAGFENDLTDVQAAIKALGGTIQDTQLDIGDLNKDITDTAATANTASVDAASSGGGGSAADQSASDAASAAAAMAASLADLAAQLKRQNDLSDHVMSITATTAIRAMADMLSGQIAGVGLNGRQMTAGAGSVYAA